MIKIIFIGFILCFGYASFAQQDSVKLHNEYDAKIAKADQAFQVKDFSKSRQWYIESINLRPDQKYPKDQIARINTIEQEIKSEQKYVLTMERANELYLSQDFEKARDLYQKAFYLTWTDTLPLHRIQELTPIIKEYGQLYKEAIATEQNFEMEKAYVLFEKASLLLPLKRECNNRMKAIKYTLNNIEVVNKVGFSTFEDYTSKEKSPSIEFQVVITNNTYDNIPDLGVTNRSKHLNLFINDSLSNPVSLYNGIEVTDAPRIIEVGESDEYQIVWILGPDSGIEDFYGEEFKVHWTYIGIKSASILVNLKEKTAIPIR